MESAELVTRIPSEDAQNIMRYYMESTDAIGEIPFYNPAAYAQALGQHAWAQLNGQAVSR